MSTTTENILEVKGGEDDDKLSQKGTKSSSIMEEVESIISALPKERALPIENYLYQGHWLNKRCLAGSLICQKHFKAQPSNVILASQPKCGTTWLKALAFTIMNRNMYDFATHPLLSSNPHDCVPFLEIYALSNPSNPTPTLPLLGTHLPYELLPESILSSDNDCPIVYIAREPKDVFVSRWNFVSTLKPVEASSTTTEEQFDMFCKGITNAGPCWDHILGYWYASVELPKKVMFIKYEDLKSQTHHHVKRLAEFIGFPFSEEEVTNGIVQNVIDLCSFDKLKNLEVNQPESDNPICSEGRLCLKNYAYFRQGKVGSYKDCLTEEMIQRMDDITRSKFEGSGLAFKI